LLITTWNHDPIPASSSIEGRSTVWRGNQLAKPGA
jgi:hypothetical protein